MILGARYNPLQRQSASTLLNIHCVNTATESVDDMVCSQHHISDVYSHQQNCDMSIIMSIKHNYHPINQEQLELSIC